MASAFPAFRVSRQASGLHAAGRRPDRGLSRCIFERGSNVIEGITGALPAMLLGVKQGRHRRGRQLRCCDASRKASGLRAQGSARPNDLQLAYNIVLHSRAAVPSRLSTRRSPICFMPCCATYILLQLMRRSFRVNSYCGIPVAACLLRHQEPDRRQLRRSSGKRN